MENISYSYHNSGTSSPRSHEIDCKNASLVDRSNYRVKFMCSYGGKISPRPHGNQLSYVGGHTKILTVDRSIRISAFSSKLSALVDSSDLCFKYQLPGEDLDALVSVKNDEDLDHMMIEYDRLHRSSATARLRLFVFPASNKPSRPASPEEKTDKQRFIDTLNSAPPIPAIEVSSPATTGSTSTASTLNFLSGFDKAKTMQEAEAYPMPIKSEPERQIVGEGVDPKSTTEIQHQIQQLKRLQIQEKQARVFEADYCLQMPQEKGTSPPPSPTSGSVMPVAKPIPTSYWTERMIHPPPISVTISPATAAPGTERSVYLVPAPVAAGQGYYSHRMMPEAYREPSPPAVYSMSSSPAPPKLAPYGDGVVGPAPVADTGASAGYTGFAYDSAGRQFYYTSALGGVVSSPNQTMAVSTVDVRQVPAGPAAAQEGRVRVPRPTSPA